MISTIEFNNLFEKRENSIINKAYIEVSNQIDFEINKAVQNQTRTIKISKSLFSDYPVSTHFHLISMIEKDAGWKVRTDFDHRDDIALTLTAHQ